MGSSPAGRANPSLPAELEAALGPAWARVRDLVPASRRIPAWATIDAERIEASPLPDDPLIGARCRLFEHPDAGQALLLEPSTEGLIAAFLARHGEGWAAVYVGADAPARARLLEAGVALSAVADGPLGRERRVLATPRSGPFIILAGLD